MGRRHLVVKHLSAVENYQSVININVKAGCCFLLGMFRLTEL
jgi:hypothetical protein